jgi:peptidoglycan hydrolase-like protein with peptidoglycan-binding domain
LSPVITASLERFNAEAAKRAAEAPNALPLVRSAQMELIRLGCYVGRPDGSLTSTQAALGRYLKIEGQSADKPVVTKELLAELVKRSTRVCPIECKSGETLKGEVCVADEKAAPAQAPATASRKHNDEEDNARPRRKQQATRDREADQPRRQQKQASQPEPRVPRQQALARPSITSGGGGGGGGGGSHTMIGVGF